MHHRLVSFGLMFVIALSAFALLAGPVMLRADEGLPPVERKIDFSRQIQPVLTENCYACHGPDEKQRKEKLRLDTREGLLSVVVPGKPEQSKLWKKISSDDEEKRMPPAKLGKKLTAQQMSLLKLWIEQGAMWSMHWAFVAPKKLAVPKVSDPSWARNSIDNFILVQLDTEGLKPNKEADKLTLLRRVTLDLTGLPPTPAEADAFLADSSPEAYEKVVDRLLQSTRFGEHLAHSWLDAARYGDTHGLHLDNYREMWPFREWVIKAFNTNKPYNRFVLEQTAGDLLPDATLDQQVATGFLRCHITTSEGGSIEDECYVRNVADRIETLGSVFMGMTVTCGRCHDHKFDPFTTREYYQLFAFFNSLDGKPLDGNAAQHPPVVRVARQDQLAMLEKADQKVAGVRKAIAEELARIKYEDPGEGTPPPKNERADFIWIEDGLPVGAKPVADNAVNLPWKWVEKPAYSGTKSAQLSGAGLKQFVLHEANPGLLVGKGDILFAYVYLDPTKPTREIMLQWHTSNWLHRAYWGENKIDWGTDGSSERFAMGPLPEAGKWVRLEVPIDKVGIKPGTTINGWAFTQFDGTVHWDAGGIVTNTPQSQQSFDSLTAWLRVQQTTGGAGLPKPIQDAVKAAPQKRTDKQKQELRDHFLQYICTKMKGNFTALNQQLADAEKARAELDKQFPTTLVFKEAAEPRPSYILKRGEYDRKGEQVDRDTPAVFPPFPPDAPRNRLGFAQWLIADQHPLTARVQVNRLWQHCFGAGLVKTIEDFGTQGEAPSHPELLDWLAVTFREEGWDMKLLLKKMVTSATYRQSSRITRDSWTKDPGNRLLSRGSRYRLEAEMLRDQALFVSGLLVEKIGGPSVKPPQPAGLWEAVGYTSSNTAKFTADSGHEKVHRRSLYTFWKRTAPPPQMSALDAPSREACTLRRERTNTPLQALLLMNETQFVECARSLAERTLREGGTTPEERLTYMFRLALIRKPDATELKELQNALNRYRETFTGDVEGAKKFIAVGETKPDPNLNPSELAAYTTIGNLLLNLDELLNKG